MTTMMGSHADDNNSDDADVDRHCDDNDAGNVMTMMTKMTIMTIVMIIFSAIVTSCLP